MPLAARKPAEKLANGIPPRGSRSAKGTVKCKNGLSKQLPLIRAKDLGRMQHGGDLRAGRRKLARPFSPDAAIHVVLKSDRAKGSWSLLHRRNRSRTDELIYSLAKQRGIRVYHRANVGNHLHVLLKAPDKSMFQSFLRALSGLLARHVTSAKKGRAIVGRYWARIPFSRLIHWGREYAALKAYLARNELEAWGFRGAKLRIHASDGSPVLVFGDEAYRPGEGEPGTGRVRSVVDAGSGAGRAPSPEAGATPKSSPTSTNRSVRNGRVDRSSR